MVFFWVMLSQERAIFNIVIDWFYFISAVYCDYAASGRSLQFIEEYITREVLPSYGNTHSTTCITSLQSTNFR